MLNNEIKINGIKLFIIQLFLMLKNENTKHMFCNILSWAE